MHIVNMYLNMKYNVLVYDSRGHGESEPTACTLGFYEKNDLDSACEYLIKNYQVEEISFHGQSMGAITILLYLNVLQVKSHNQLFKRAVLDCPASHMPRQMNNYYSKYFALPRFFFMFGMTYFLKKLNHYSGRNIIPIRRIYKSWR